MNITISFPTVVTPSRLRNARDVIRSRLRYLLAGSPRLEGNWMLTGFHRNHTPGQIEIWQDIKKLRSGVDYTIRGSIITFPHPPGRGR